MIAKSPNVLFRDLYDLQRAGVMVDTRLILDDGELSIHWSMLDIYGHQQWWTGLGEAGADIVVILPGVSLMAFCFKNNVSFVNIWRKSGSLTYLKRVDLLLSILVTI